MKERGYMMESDRLSARKSTLEDHIRSRTKASRETIKDKFHWTSEAAKALEDLKHRLQIPPILTAPSPGENLLLYIEAINPCCQHSYRGRATRRRPCLWS